MMWPNLLYHYRYWN